MIKETALTKLSDIFHRLPTNVQEDIKSRVSDWLASGGKDDDPYIYQQLRYAEKIIEQSERED